MLEKSSHFHCPGEMKIVFGDLSVEQIRLTFRLAQLNPCADANVIQDLEEPFDLFAGKMELETEFILYKVAWLAKHFFELPFIFALLLGECFLEQFMVFNRFGMPACHGPFAEMTRDQDRVTLENCREQFAFFFPDEEKAGVIGFFEQFHRDDKSFTRRSGAQDYSFSMVAWRL